MGGGRNERWVGGGRKAKHFNVTCEQNEAEIATRHDPALAW